MYPAKLMRPYIQTGQLNLWTARKDVVVVAEDYRLTLGQQLRFLKKPGGIQVKLFSTFYVTSLTVRPLSGFRPLGLKHKRA